jgi:diguanylate cyclase (GGDEF)-like protein
MRPALTVTLLLAALAANVVEAAAPVAHPALAPLVTGEQQVRRDPDASRRGAEAALAALALQPDPDLEMRSRILLCDYFSERDSARAGAELEAMKPLLTRLTRHGLAAGEALCTGLIAEAGGNNDAAQVAYDRATRVSEEAADDEMLADSLYSRGYLLGVRGDYANGLADLRRAQALFERLSKDMHALTTLNGIAIIYNRMGDTAQAESIYQRALIAQRAAGLTREETVTLYNLGRAAEALRDWPRARISFEGALRLARDLGYRRAEIYALRGLASVTAGEGRPAEALARLSEAKALLDGVPDARLASQIALTEGVILRKLGRLPAARVSFERARPVMEEGDALGDLVVLYDELALLAVETGDWRGAYEARSRSRDVNESLLRRQIDQRFATLKVEFDTATKEKENAALLKTNAANQRALEQTDRASRLQAVAIALAAILVAVLGALAWHQRRSSLRMRALALTDELTEAPNRRAVLGRLQDLLAANPPRRVCLLLLDIDHFKSINDRHGHPVGDKVLKAVAARLLASLQAGDLHGRIGGEEFLVAVPDESLETVLARAEVLRFQFTTIDTHLWFDSPTALTMSIGVAERRPEDTLSSLLQRADTALYAAKREGRNCVRHAEGASRTMRDLAG